MDSYVLKQQPRFNSVGGGMGRGRPQWLKGVECAGFAVAPKSTGNATVKSGDASGADTVVLALDVSAVTVPVQCPHE